MKLIEAETTLVIAGAWNPAIVSPNWIAHHALGFARDQDFKVQLQMPVQGVGIAPRFAFEDLTIHAQPDSLIFVLDPNRPEQVTKSFNTAAAVLNLLVHTPVAGLGINLSYSLEAADGPLVPAFKTGETVGALSDDDGWSVLQQSYKLSVKLSDHVLNLDVLKIGQELKLALNHHFDCNSAAAAAGILKKEQRFEALRALSDKMASRLEKADAEHA
jgi:hypothetical protein